MAHGFIFGGIGLHRAAKTEKTGARRRTIEEETFPSTTEERVPGWAQG